MARCLITLTALCVLISPAQLFAGETPPTALARQLSPQEAQHIGKLIWLNEGLGKVENLTVWNKREEFPSLGIGHFIWYPSGKEGPFIEQFPKFIALLKTTTRIPAWLETTEDAPWPTRAAFYADIDSERMRSLRELLANTLPQQTAFMIARLEAALPKMVSSLADAEQQRLVQQRFYRVAQQPMGIYALIDYVNFKGEGTSPKERYKGQGWGLLQLLQNMDDDNPNVMANFVAAADTLLTRRVKNAPRDETAWLSGWRKRLATYLK